MVGGRNQTRRVVNLFFEGFGYEVQLFTDACEYERLSWKRWLSGKGRYCKQLWVFALPAFLGCLYAGFQKMPQGISTSCFIWKLVARTNMM